MISLVQRLFQCIILTWEARLVSLSLALTLLIIVNIHNSHNWFVGNFVISLSVCVTVPVV